QAQSIEGYWQDTERRILFSSDAPPGYVYGRWTALDQQQTYPSAKYIGDAKVVDLLYDTEEVINVGRTDQRMIEFTRTNTWSRCEARHKCALEGPNQMLCALETSCPVAGAEQVVWRGEERYARRESCERVDKRQAQGIPQRCR
ncbi:MAG TPA: hypothetical protein VM183_03260, partial [Burkholderiales bacterium]|nr:hypothetical protein [Burkholderiales bacterium]